MIDQAELAWAAGFFDGEGSTIARTYTDRPGYYQLNVTVPQACAHGVPPSLLRFQLAMLGMGEINGPAADDLYMLRFGARAEIRVVLQLLWPHLGEVKRAQATSAIAVVDAQYASGRIRSRKARRVAPTRPTIMPCSPEDAERAWAAGFLDAEGCFGLNRGKPRVRGPVWYRIRVSADQHGVPGTVPDVLLRLQRAMGGIGRFERHGSPDDYKWCAEGRSNVERVLAVAGEWLGQEKRAYAREVLERFDAQVRLKGDATHCVRGHLYTHVALKGGRARRICNACERISDRARRAAQGIPPRQFKNLARRYTS